MHNALAKAQENYKILLYYYYLLHIIFIHNSGILCPLTAIITTVPKIQIDLYLY